MAACHCVIVCKTGVLGRSFVFNMADIQQSFSASHKSAGPSMSLIDNKQSMGVGNYKGVMLCNRPFAGSVGRLIALVFLFLMFFF